jgi:hypothetical protein
MATHVGNGVESIAHLPGSSYEVFRQVWHLDSLRIAKTDDGFWLKGLTAEDIKRAEVRSILNLQFFELKELFLYLKGNLVPERKMPSGLLWHPIQQALKVDLPSFNENLFEVPGSLNLEFIPSSDEQDIFMSIVMKADLLKYVDSVPQHFYNELKWCVFGKEQAILLGVKIPSIVSVRYWKYKHLLLPVGYSFKYEFLKEVVNELHKKAGQNDYWVFNNAGSFFSLPQDPLSQMSRSSVKQTILEC